MNLAIRCGLGVALTCTACRVAYAYDRGLPLDGLATGVVIATLGVGVLVVFKIFADV